VILPGPTGTASRLTHFKIDSPGLFQIDKSSGVEASGSAPTSTTDPIFDSNDTVYSTKDTKPTHPRSTSSTTN
jgi:hypothetical protein